MLLSSIEFIFISFLLMYYSNGTYFVILLKKNTDKTLQYEKNVYLYELLYTDHIIAMKCP